MASVRYRGRLRQWNTERGYGFILANDSGQDVFVRISAFPRDGRVPVVDDELTFEVEPDGKGKKHAVRVQCLAAQPPSRPSPASPSVRPLSRAPQNASWASRTIGLLVLVLVGWYSYNQYDRHRAQVKTVALSPAFAAQTALAPSPPSGFNCDGRTHCSQMSSCKEAKFFLKNCPGVEMDGNHDGVPCEQQWCTSPWAD